jgi:hypothetical protein
MIDLLLLLATVMLVALVGRFSEEIGERLWRPKPHVPCQEWRDMVEPIVKKCRLSATFNGSTRFDGDGSSALAALLERMATELDQRS